MPSKPKLELIKIKSAVIPEVVLVELHPKNKMSGDKKIPPPVPVKPAKNPMHEPIITAKKNGGFLSFLSILFDRFETREMADIKRMIPTIDL